MGRKEVPRKSDLFESKMGTQHPRAKIPGVAAQKTAINSKKPASGLLFRLAGTPLSHARTQDQLKKVPSGAHESLKG